MLRTFNDKLKYSMQLSKVRYSWLIAGGLVLVYLVTRLYHLLSVPIFTDEAVYIHWAQLFAEHIHRNMFVSLNDGKQPLFIWLGFPFIKLIHDPLLAMRLVSVVTDGFTLLGLYLLTKELFHNKRMAVLASVLYLIYPFALVYDRMALYDGLLAGFAVWSVYIEVLLVRRRQLWIALLGAIVVGGALLTKSSADFYLFLMPFSLLLFKAHGRNKQKQWQDLIRWGILAAVLVTGALAIASILKLSPNYQFISEKNSVFVEPLHLWIKHPFAHVATNLPIQAATLAGYVTIPVLALAALALLVDRQFLKEKLLLAIWSVVPFVAIVFFGTLLFPRYQLFLTMPLLVLAASAAEFTLRKVRPIYLAVGLLIALSLPMLWKDYFLLTNFYRASIPEADHAQFIGSSTSGGGVKEIADYIRKQAKGQPAYVGGEGTLGLIPEGIQDYLYNDKNITVEGYWPITANPPVNLLQTAQKMPTYFIFYAPCEACASAGVGPKAWPLQPVLAFPKSDGSSFNLYKVTN